jgi:TRAP-type mannitol/chloroaromatic compound transport system substrate-binding protein
MQQKQGVRFYKTPDSVLARQLVVYDQAADKRKDNALFNEIAASQKDFAARAVRWQLDTQVSTRMAYNHYFGKPAAKPAEKKA